MWSIGVSFVSKKFDSFLALDDLSLQVENGSVYGLVGPNGAGKSTIIRHLTGVYRQDAGEVFVNGKEVFENRLVKEKIELLKLAKNGDKIAVIPFKLI